VTNQERRGQHMEMNGSQRDIGASCSACMYSAM